MNDNQIVFSDRDLFIFKYLVEEPTSLRPTKSSDSHRQVLVICADGLSEFIVCHVFQALSFSSAIHVDHLPPLDPDANAAVWSLKLQLLLKSNEVLVTSWSTVQQMLEVNGGAYFSFDFFDTVGLWDCQRLEEFPGFEMFLKQCIRPRRESTPRVVSLMRHSGDVDALQAAVRRVRNCINCISPIMCLQSANYGRFEADRTVPLSLEQRTLYQQIALKMKQVERQIETIIAGYGLRWYPGVGLHCVVGTHEYQQWLEMWQTLVHRANVAQFRPEDTRDIWGILCVLRLWNTALKLLEETSCKEALALLENAQQSPLDFTMGSVSSTLLDAGMMAAAGQPPVSIDWAMMQALNSTLLASLTVPTDATALTSASAKVTGCLTLMTEFQSKNAGRGGQMLVVCWCRESLQYLAQHCDQAAVQAYYLTETVGKEAPQMLPHVTSFTHRRLLRNAFVKDCMEKTHTIILTTRYTLVSTADLKDLPWTDVCHYDADLYSVCAHRFSAGWDPRVMHIHFYSESSEGVVHCSMDHEFLGALEEQFPDLQKITLINSRPGSSCGSSPAPSVRSSSSSSHPTTTPCLTDPMLWRNNSCNAMSSRVIQRWQSAPELMKAKPQASIWKLDEHSYNTQMNSHQGGFDPFNFLASAAPADFSLNLPPSPKRTGATRSVNFAAADDILPRSPTTDDGQVPLPAPLPSQQNGHGMMGALGGAVDPALVEQLRFQLQTNLMPFDARPTNGTPEVLPPPLSPPSPPPPPPVQQTPLPHQQFEMLHQFQELQQRMGHIQGEAPPAPPPAPPVMNGHLMQLQNIIRLQSNVLMQQLQGPPPPPPLGPMPATTIPFPSAASQPSHLASPAGPASLRTGPSPGMGFSDGHTGITMPPMVPPQYLAMNPVRHNGPPMANPPPAALQDRQSFGQHGEWGSNLKCNTGLLGHLAPQAFMGAPQCFMEDHTIKSPETVLPSVSMPSNSAEFGPGGEELTSPVSQDGGENGMAWDTNSSKITKSISQKMERAKQQLMQAGEYAKQRERRLPSQPWPLASMAKPRPFAEADAKQIWNHNFQKLYPKTPPAYYFSEKIIDDNVYFLAETELCCRVPTFDGDTQGYPFHFRGCGEALTKKDAQKAAAINILAQLAEFHLLHIPSHYANRRVDVVMDGSSEPHPVKKQLADHCLKEWHTKPVYTNLSEERHRPNGQDFECLVHVNTPPGLPERHFSALGSGRSKKDAERDAAQKLFQILRPYFISAP